MRSPPRPALTPSRERKRLVLIRDAFYRQVPFVGSGGLYNPGPETTAPLLAMLWPLDDTLASPWVLRRSSLDFSDESDSRLLTSLDSLADGFTRRPSLRARSPFTRPCRSFWSAFAELIRDQTSPTDFCNALTTCGQPNPSSCDPRRDGGLDLLPFLEPATPSSLRKR